MNAEHGESDLALRRLASWLERAGLLWLMTLPLLRPLIWSGEATDLPNLFYLVLLAAATATGLMLRGMRSPAALRPGLAGILGLVFLAIAAAGACHSLLSARAWMLVVIWALHLAAPLALMPLIRARPEVALAGLVAGVLCEGLVLLGQVLYERPDLQQAYRDDPALVAQPQLRDQYSVRIASWRLEGSFLLANTLAAYLITLLPLLAATTVAAWRTRSPERVMLGFALAVASVALVLTGSKAGMLALALAGAATLIWLRRSWAARMGLALALIGVISAALAVPAIRTHAWASFAVRVDYWRAALLLIAEHPLIGSGLEGFMVHYPRVKLPGAEDTIMVHQEVLQTAVDLGIPAAVLLVVWWAAVLWRLRPRSASATLAPSSASASPAVRAPPLPWPLLLGSSALVGFALLLVGVLHANFLAYPGGHDGATAPWAVALTCLVLLILAGLRSLPAIPPSACGCGVLACMLHAQADFHLHSAQVVGTLALVAILGCAQRAADEPPTRTPAAAPRKAWQWTMVLAGMAVLIAVTLGVMAAALCNEVLEQGRRAEDCLRRASLALAPGSTLSADQKEQARELLGDELLRHGLVGDDPQSIGQYAISSATSLIVESERFPHDSDLALVAAGVLIYGYQLSPATLDGLQPLAERLTRDWPGQLAYAKCLADILLRSAMRAHDMSTADARQIAERAERAAQEVVELYPTCLPFRESLIKAAELNHDAATVARESALIRQLQDQVYYTNRPTRRF